MYMRTTKSGGHEYVSLAHNQRDPETGQSRARILYKFGHKDQLDVAELKRLIASISRFIGPADVDQLRRERVLDGMFEFLGAKRLGATHALLYWLALLPIHVTENETAETWHQIKKILHPLSVANHQMEHGKIAQTNKPTKPAKRVVDALKMKPSERFLAISSPENRS